MKYIAVLLTTLMLLLGSCRDTMVSYDGCTSYWDETSFPIVVSPDASFTAEDVAWVAMAAQRWNLAVEAQVFIVVPGILQEPGAQDFEGIVLTQLALRGSLLGYCSIHYYKMASGRIWRGACQIDNVYIQPRQSYQEVVVHELGHALGFPHDSDPESIMASHPTSQESMFQQKHIDTMRAMMEGTYKGTSLFGNPSCL